MRPICLMKKRKHAYFRALVRKVAPIRKKKALVRKVIGCKALMNEWFFIMISESGRQEEDLNCQ